MSDDGEVRRRLCLAMRYEGDDWLDRAEHLLDGQWRAQQQRKIVDVTTVGGRLRAAREAMGLSQEQVALRLSVPAVRVSDWERGRRDLDGATFHRLVALYRPVTTRAWLLMETSDGAPRVPLDVLGKRHTRRGYAWLERKRKWQKAQAEAEARNQARKARAREGGSEPKPPQPG